MRWRNLGRTQCTCQVQWYSLAEWIFNIKDWISFCKHYRYLCTEDISKQSSILLVLKLIHHIQSYADWRSNTTSSAIWSSWSAEERFTAQAYFRCNIACTSIKDRAIWDSHSRSDGAWNSCCSSSCGSDTGGVRRRKIRNTCKTRRPLFVG